MSHAQLGRIERTELRQLSFEQAAAAAAAVGLRLSVRLYPDGDPVRDTAHLALIERFRSRLGPGIACHSEAPLPLAGDLRAWDVLLTSGGRRCGCEAETVLRDVQALQRRVALKARDGRVDVVVLILADTSANRAALEMHREELRDLLPLDIRAVLRHLGNGQLPPRSGIAVL